MDRDWIAVLIIIAVALVTVIAFSVLVIPHPIIAAVVLLVGFGSIQLVGWTLIKLGVVR